MWYDYYRNWHDCGYDDLVNVKKLNYVWEYEKIFFEGNFIDKFNLGNFINFL